MRYLPETSSIRRVLSVRAQMRVPAVHRKGGLRKIISGKHGGEPVPCVLVRREERCLEELKKKKSLSF